MLPTGAGFLVTGILMMVFGVLLLISDTVASFVRKTPKGENSVARRIQGWFFIAIGLATIAWWKYRADFMDAGVFLIVLVIFGLLSLAFGLGILLSDKFYEKWRDSFWRESNDKHLSRDSLIYNRYTRGGSSAVMGGLILIILLSALFR